MTPRERSEARKKGVGGKNPSNDSAMLVYRALLTFANVLCQQTIMFIFFFFATINLPDRILPNLEDR